jgi:chromosome segregation ATPase
MDSQSLKKPKLVIDSLRTLEIIEIQEEEKYIFNLKFQRDKIEEFRQEMIKKNNRIKELEGELEIYTAKKTDIDKYISEISYLNKELKEREIENIKLRAALSSQVDEYENSIHELKQVVLKEREDQAREINFLKSELASTQDDLESAVSALEKANSTIQSLEKRVDSEILSSKEREKNSADHTKHLKNTEKLLKEELVSFRQENHSQKETIRLLTEKINKQIQLEQDLDTIKSLLSEEKRKNKELNKKYSESIEKNDIFKKNIEDEYNSLKEELDQAIEIITRQESSLQDLRERKQEDDLKIMTFDQEIQFRDQEMGKVEKLCTKLNSIIEDNKEHISDLNYKIQSLTSENNQIKSELQTIYAKQDKERDERKKLAKKKLDLLTQRNEEISKLNEVFSTIDS